MKGRCFGIYYFSQCSYTRVLDINMAHPIINRNSIIVVYKWKERMLERIQRRSLIGFKNELFLNRAQIQRGALSRYLFIYHGTL